MACQVMMGKVDSLIIDSTTTSNSIPRVYIAMTAILPGNSSTAYSSRYKFHNTAGPPTGAWFPPECEPDFMDDDGSWASGANADPDTNPPTSEDKKSTSPSAFDPYASLGFDEYGTELGKEARVWKVYIKETDKWDAELVDGWNKSLDVTLIFAALFSAISTAFIIESTGALQDDPADITAQTLLQISQTLHAMANNSTPPDRSLSGSIEATGFTPSRSMVIVNTLWYLSLSLSIATSFLAILAKDWCHSFMANRSGHPCIQARRRQRKWTMIEKWKMQELLAALPLLIHISLLLFAVGLCVYMWDIDQTVAIPVICVTGGAALFYAGSTLTATVLDSFPYTTIVSRILGSELLRLLYMVMQAGGIYLILIPLRLSLRMIASAGAQWKRLGIECVESWLRSLDVRDDGFRDWFQSKPWEISSPEAPSQDAVTSQALSWIIKYCEVPQAVDIALQAIAGANERLPRKPLLECKASSALSQRLASSNLYKGEKTNEQRIALYLRALSYIGSEDLVESTGDVEVVLWDLQAENERRVSELLTDGEFTPDDHNLAALRIDNMATSQVLGLLKDNFHDAIVVLNQILLLLEQHSNYSRQLHPAARLSVLNATILLTACTPNYTVPMGLTSLCIKIFATNHILYSSSDDIHLPLRLIIIILLRGRPNNPDYSGSPRNLISLHALRVFQVFLALQSASREALEQFIWFGAIEIMSNPSDYGIEPAEEDISNQTLEYARHKMAPIIETLPRPADHNRTSNSAERLAFPILQSLSQVYTTISVGAPDGAVYMFVVECMLCVWSDRMDWHCWSIMSAFRFPKLSAELIDYVEKRSLIQVFHKHMEVSYDAMQFFAATQLWLLLTLYLDPPFLDSDSLPGSGVGMAKLQALLQRSPLLKSDVSNIEEAREELGVKIEQLEGEIEWGEGPSIIYALRVLESVLQSRNFPPSDPRWDRINRGLADTPAALRGLGSFIPLPMRQPHSYTLSNTISQESHVSIPVGGNAEIEDKEALGTGVDFGSV